MRYRVSVIIPVFNDYARLAECLASLANQVEAAEAEVLVVDNDSAQIDRSMLALYADKPWFHWLEESNPGSYAARNAGLRIAQGEFLAFTDSDCIPASDWLQQGLALLELEQPKADAIAGRVAVFCQENCPRTLLESFELVLAFPQYENSKLGRSVTANYWIRRSVVEQIGHFDCDAFSGADYEFSSRAVKHGAVMVYGEHCVVAHPARQQLSQMRQKLRRVVGGFYRLQHRDPMMAKQLNWRTLLADLAPPVQAYRSCIRQKQHLQLSLLEITRIMLVALHNKWYRLWLKLRANTGFTGFIER